tara:strand:+ start:376 stop:549 length:174 start_codon:yes stop_codon:yes gene_type:complete
MKFSVDLNQTSIYGFFPIKINDLEISTFVLLLCMVNKLPNAAGSQKKIGLGKRRLAF